jgi:hypothetical protein
MERLSSKELCKALNAIKDSYKEISPDSKDEGKSIKFGINVLEQAIQAIEQSEQAIELLKEFAFYGMEESIQEHLEQALKVQEFLMGTDAKDWLEEQLTLCKCDDCEKYDECENQDGSCDTKKYYIGKHVKVEFDGEEFSGRIVDFKEGKYRVSDGDYNNFTLSCWASKDELDKIN